MAIQNQGWAYVSGSATGAAGGADTNIQFNNAGALGGSSDLTWDGSTVATTDISASINISASAFYGDGSNLTSISSDDVDTTTDTTNTTRYIPFVANATSTDGEILLIDDAISINPSTGVFTVAGSAPSLGIGSAVLVEADMEKIDGITNGTAAASKAVVLDASKNIATLGTVGCGAITSTGASTMGSLNIGGTLACDTSFTIDAVVLNATELGYVDGVTAGTAIASKAVVLDASKDLTGVNNLTASFFKGDGSALTNLPGGGGGGGLLTAINGTQVYLTSSLAIGGSSAPDHTLSISGSISGSGILRAASFAADGAAVLGGSLTAVGVVAGGAISSATSIDGSGDLTMGTITMTGFSVDADGDVSVKSLDVNSGGITEAGAISGVTSIDGDGDLTMGTITMTGFSVASGGATTCESLALGGADFSISNAGAISYGTSYSGSTTIQGSSLSVDGAVTAGSLNLAGAAVTATAAELNYLDDDDLTAADLTKLAGLTATAAEINYLDNADLTAADLTKLAGLTATAAEINYLDDDNLTAADLTKLAAVYATAAQLNFNYNVTAGTAKASKSVVLDVSKDVTGINNLTSVGTVSAESLSGSTVLGGNVTPYLAQQILDPQTDWALFTITNSSTTTYRVVWDDGDTSCTAPVVTFTAPPSGKVMVDLQHYIDDTSSTGDGPTVYACLSTSTAASIGITDGTIVTGEYERRIWQAVTTLDAIHNYSFLVESLTPGNSYTWYLFLRRYNDGDDNRVICGKNYPLFQMSVRAILETADIYNS